MRAGQLVKVLLAYRNMTQAQLGKRLGVSKQSVQCALKDAKHGMRIDVFCRYVEALDYKVIVVPSTATLGHNSYELTENHDSPESDIFSTNVEINPDGEEPDMPEGTVEYTEN